MNIEEIIIKTKTQLTDHWNRTVSSRLSTGSMGSRYPQHEDPESLEQTLVGAEWEEYSHPAISGAVGWKANIPGEIGMVSLDDLDDDCEVQLVDPKKTGFLSAVVEGDNYVPTAFTVMIIGDNNGDLVVYTFHPGDPVERSSITGEERTTTVKEARELGFGLAKIELKD